MKRPLAAAVLLLFVTALSYATAAEALGHHHEGPAGCDNASLHICADQAPHDADSCAFCHLDGVAFALPVIEAPLAQLRSVSALGVSSDPLPSAIASGPFAPRGPPALAA